MSYLQKKKKNFSTHRFTRTWGIKVKLDNLVQLLRLTTKHTSTKQTSCMRVKYKFWQASRCCYIQLDRETHSSPVPTATDSSDTFLPPSHPKFYYNVPFIMTSFPYEFFSRPHLLISRGSSILSETLIFKLMLC